jgi:membrane protein YdbS with pleckstrin-like domain
MKCKQCGAEIVQGAAFCQACGVAVGSAANAMPQPLAPELPLGDPSPGKARLTTPMMSGTGDDSEQVLWRGRFSVLAMIGEWLGGAIITVAAIIIGVVAGFTSSAWWWTVGALAVVWGALVLRLLYKQMSIRYELTNQRFIHERGILWRVIDRVEAIDIDDVAVQQGPVERMLGVGSVLVRSSDASTPQLLVEGIDDVRQVATMIDDARRKERRKRGVYVEQV